jgi:hypothetical protein
MSLKKRKKALEKTTETAILTYLNFLSGCFAWKNNSTGVYDAKRGTFRSNKNKFVINGVSDVLGVYNGRLLAIEVKTDKGVVSKEQQDFIDRVNKLGGIAGVARSISDVKELIKKDGGNNANQIKGVSE